MFVAHDIGRPSVIDELRLAVWVCADRPGIQFSAEVTLPRTIDPRTTKPLTTNVLGASYTAVGRWQQLVVADFTRAVTRQVRVLRSQLAMDLDAREAYVSRVLLNIYGGPGVTNVWTDDLEVFGYVTDATGASVRRPWRLWRLLTPQEVCRVRFRPPPALANRLRGKSSWPVRS